MAMQELSDAASGDGSHALFSAPSSPHDDASACSDWTSDPVNEGPSNLKIPRSPNQRHSTLVDINFVQNYFKIILRTKTINLTLLVRDCFFVSVVIRNRPELKDKPVSICHSDNPRGTAEISSANYPARGYGVKAGMFVRDAKSRCPHLVILSYDFEAYEEVADRFHNILHKYCNKVQAVSCDETFLDGTDSGAEDIQAFVSVIRKEILDTTGCTASAAITGNMLMVRLATRIAKPDGQCYIPAEKVEEHQCALPVKALPGIGHVLEEKLNRKQITICGQLRMISKEILQDFGSKTGNVEDIRGMGLQISKLETADSSKQDNSKNSGDERQAQFQGDSSTPFIEMTAALPSVTAGIGQRGTLPPMNELDIGVIESLPPEVFSEINDMYHGRLAHFITEKRSKGVSEKVNIVSVFPAALNDAFSAREEHQYNEEEIQVTYPNKLFADMKSEPVSDASVPNLDLFINAPVPGGISLMPASLSQVDTSVFQELPEELRTDVL
ncbi:hypothetical protein RND71_000335 [Anisodus tanguticus]|uniref:UmuC domain-containing protein n=1 Tax=Anisodus tanguticus TaxID=243964 RepID=A0AAE1VPX5_9SOLA|nr:hypothetical protein RND71_000335 [Anisodus tanguticus]